VNALLDLGASEQKLQCAFGAAAQQVADALHQLGRELGGHLMRAVQAAQEGGEQFGFAAGGRCGRRNPHWGRSGSRRRC
jgi:hypothetical protein